MKELEAFAWRRESKGQRDNYCRPCRASYKQEHYAANRQRYIDNATKRKQLMLRARIVVLLEFLTTHPCVDCGETDQMVLEFDHLADKLSRSVAACVTAIGTPCSPRWPSAT